MNAPSMTFAELLRQAVTEPGIVSRAYFAFHNYSIGNQLLAWSQCMERGLPLGPITTFQRWKELGRCVRRGEKALTLCRPVTVKRTSTADDGTEQTNVATWFVYKPYWFVLAQTDGREVEPLVIPEWNQVRALEILDIVEEPFSIKDGNCQGYARQRSIAVSPVAELPHKTRFHELAHVVLGHTSEAEAGLTDSEMTPRSLREVETEAVALVCLEALGLPGAEHCRGYIQHWNQQRGAEPIPERSAQRIFKAADQILKAGTTETGAESV
jgi:antirestriction protein ArdC